MSLIAKLFAGLSLALFISTGAVGARDILPLAQDRYSITLPRDGQDIPFQQGTTVEFIGTSDKGIPEPLDMHGMVLGARNGAIFIEVSDWTAVRLAHVRAKGPVKLRITKEPDEEEVVARKALAERNDIFQLAPRLREVTVRTTVEPSDVMAMSPGDRLRLATGQQRQYRTYKDGKYVLRTREIIVSAIFVSADSDRTNGLELTMLAEPSDAFLLVRAGLKGRLSLKSKEEPVVTSKDRRRCYVRRRHETEVISIEIPCVPKQ